MGLRPAGSDLYWAAEYRGAQLRWARKSAYHLRRLRGPQCYEGRASRESGAQRGSISLGAEAKSRRAFLYGSDSGKCGGAAEDRAVLASSGESGAGAIWSESDVYCATGVLCGNGLLSWSEGLFLHAAIASREYSR